MPDKTDLPGTHRVTLKDIAKKTGFTINTVSRSLKDKVDISAPTRQLIKDTALQMGYINNSIAGSLRSGSTKTIAIILGDISNPLFSILVKDIDMAVRPHGYNTFIINTDENDALELEAIQSALGKNVDGIILCPAQKNEDNVSYLMRTGVPFVLVERYFQNLETDCVVCDDVQGGYLATKHLTEKGHKRILMLVGPTYISSARERLEGYRKALAETGIPFDSSLVHEVSITSGNTKKVLQDIMAKETDFTAILAFSDMIAWETIGVLDTIGKRVPEDIAVVGFDNIQAKWPFPVPLTTISPSKDLMVKYAVEILLNRMKNKQPDKHTSKTIPTKLVIREST